LVAAREFISGEWFRFPRRQDIRQAIWIRGTPSSTNSEKTNGSKPFSRRKVKVIGKKTGVVGESVRVLANRVPRRDLVIATDLGVWET